MKVFKRIVSHATLILSLMIATFEVLDIFNPAMGFVKGPLPSAMRYLFCAFAFTNALTVIIRMGKEDVAAKREKAGRKEETSERNRADTAPVRTAPERAAAAKTSGPAPVKAPVSPEKRAASAMKETVQPLPGKNVPVKTSSEDPARMKTVSVSAETAPSAAASPVKKEGPKTGTSPMPLPAKQKTEESVPSAGAAKETKSALPVQDAPSEVRTTAAAPASGQNAPRVTTDVGRVRIRSEKTASVRTPQTSPDPAAKKDVTEEKTIPPVPQKTVQEVSADRVLEDDEEL